MMRIQGETVVVERERILGHFMGATDSLGGRIFCGKPASTPDQVRGKLFPENAPYALSVTVSGGRRRKVVAKA
jgi:hypothetical protein